MDLLVMDDLTADASSVKITTSVNCFTHCLAIDKVMPFEFANRSHGGVRLRRCSYVWKKRCCEWLYPQTDSR